LHYAVDFFMGFLIRRQINIAACSRKKPALEKSLLQFAIEFLIHPFPLFPAAGSGQRPGRG